MAMTFTSRTALCAALVLAHTLVSSSPAAPVQILAAQYRADVPFPEFEALWRKDSAATTNPAPKATLTGGCVQLYLRNTTQQPVVIEDVLVEGISLTQAIAETQERKFKKHLRANSLYFSKLSPAEKEKLIALGEPVWWRVDPKTLAPGAAGEVLIRLRKDPPGARLNCVLKLSEGPAQEVAVPTANVVDRCTDVCFAPGLETAWLYFAGREHGRVPKRILLDGEDVTASCQIGTDAHLNLAPVVLHPPKAFAPASLHCFQAVYDDGAIAIATSARSRRTLCMGCGGQSEGRGTTPPWAGRS
jgi:hypothetical protein